MKPRRGPSLKRKLTAIVIATSMVTLLAVGACFLVYEWLTAPQTVAKSLDSLASVIGNNSTAALAFDDQNAAQDTLNGLRATPSIVVAYLFRKDGTAFVGYRRDGRDNAMPQCIQELSHYQRVDRYVELCRKIEHRGEMVGVIGLRSDLSEAYARLGNYAQIVGLAFFASLLVGLLISWVLKRLVSDPILALANVALKVSTEQNYGIRAQTENRDEIGDLFAGFNEMLEQIGRRDSDLKETHDELEKRVVELQHEVAERRRAEETLASKTVELQRSNEELEQFAYVASHDLQEPLRMITGYTQLLAKKYRGKLDDTASEYIDFAVDGAKRMQGLITDLLTYSRVGTKGKPFLPTDCELLLGTTLRNLALTIDECGGKVTHDALPILRGDASQLGQLLQNLIGNGLKYCDKKSPEIHVSCQRQEEFWRFSVKDNGIGIDPRYAERIFVIFQRLHTRDEYPGTGIGLALCKKIVERHGGRIWVESQPGRGSTFYFTLPAEQASPAQVNL